MNSSHFAVMSISECLMNHHGGLATGVIDRNQYQNQFHISWQLTAGKTAQ